MSRFSAPLCLVVLALGACGEPRTTAAPDPAVPTTTSSASVLLAQVDAYIEDAAIDQSHPDWRTRLPSPPILEFDGNDVLWQLETSLGAMTIRLMPDIAPMHVSSTVYLTRLGFYDGLTFHRIIPGFMAQGGDPLGNGTGGPGYQYGGEFDDGAAHDAPGMLSMANAGPGTDGSQFFITFAPAPHLNGRHTVFGELVDGMETLERIEATGSPSGRPSERVTIERARIES